MKLQRYVRPSATGFAGDLHCVFTAAVQLTLPAKHRLHQPLCAEPGRNISLFASPWYQTKPLITWRESGTTSAFQSSEEV